MKKIIFSLILSATFFLIIGFSNYGKDLSNLSLSFSKIDASNIRTSIWNDGSFDRDFNTFDAGFE